MTLAMIAASSITAALLWSLIHGAWMNAAIVALAAGLAGHERQEPPLDYSKGRRRSRRLTSW
jgi:hypothetical protein